MGSRHQSKPRTRRGPRAGHILVGQGLGGCGQGSRSAENSGGGGGRNSDSVEQWGNNHRAGQGYGGSTMFARTPHPWRSEIGRLQPGIAIGGKL